MTAPVPDPSPDRPVSARPAVDPRNGDIEDDASSTKRRSMLSLAGSLFAEISPAKLVLSWLMLFALPALLLGFTPLVASAWGGLITSKVISPLIGLWPLLLLALLLLVALFGGRSLLRIAESSFWSLNSLVVEPVYATCREALRHLAGKLFKGEARRAVFGVVASLVAGAIMVCAAAAIAAFAWPASRWFVELSDFASPVQLIVVALANSGVIVAAYLAGAAVVWACADATMPQPHDFQRFHGGQEGGRRRRIVHLSDIHTIGEPYGFRIESGRSGPRGNGRLAQVLASLDRIHATSPIDLILITGDLTDAGRSAEWSELLDHFQAYPRLLQRTLILPGNHDLSIVDRANPARLDLPTSPNRRLRRLRFLTMADFIQGERVRVIDHSGNRIGQTLAASLAPHRDEMVRFADVARPFFSTRLDDVFAAAFPMVVPPDRSDGLGIILLNSNAEAHFSFTNALGMVTSDQIKGIEIALAEYPDAGWIIALHHHVVEYPKAAKVLSERIATALINGSWFVRRLRNAAGRVLLMHGHRHTDWFGECAGLPIVSAPSPVMEALDRDDTYFYIHTLTVEPGGRLCLLPPERITVQGDHGT